jgi:hypothetical protein
MLYRIVAWFDKQDDKLFAILVENIKRENMLKELKIKRIFMYIVLIIIFILLIAIRADIITILIIIGLYSYLLFDIDYKIKLIRMYEMVNKSDNLFTNENKIYK